MENSTTQPTQTLSSNNTPEDKMTPILSYSLYCTIYRMSKGNNNYIVKVFPPGKSNNWQREQQILSELTHTYIIKPIDFTHEMVIKATNTLKCQLTIFPEAARGSLFQYVQSNGSLSQLATRYYVSQIVEGLLFAHSKGYTHPNLLAQNILIGEDRKILIGGWSNSIGNFYHKLQDLLFAIGQLIISLTTSRRPFISKDYKNDPFAKFLSDKFIHKFWEQIQKIVKKVNKQFKFTQQLKNLVSSLFLGKIHTFDQILHCNWLQVPVSEEQVLTELQNQQKQALIKKETLKSKALNSQKQEKQLVSINQSRGLARKPSRSNQIFQQEYASFQSAQITFQQKRNGQLSYFKFFDNQPRLAISHLRTKLREAIRDKQDILDPLLLLKDFQVSVEQEHIQISCTFGWNYEQIQESISLCGYNYTINLILCKQQNDLLGRLTASEPSDLNAECTTRLNSWIISHLQYYG